ncbi:MAG: hypothetical protein IK130_01550 [Oscillospiraceae bacterium]|nr:hypothetical protein [Oscillospiraceae bacterium]
MTTNEDITTQSADSSPAEPILDRNLYRTIKKMDRDTLQGLIQNIFEQGRQKGLSETQSEIQTLAADDYTLDLRELEKQIKAVKGVGEKRAEEIMRVVEDWLGVEE